MRLKRARKHKETLMSQTGTAALHTTTETFESDVLGSDLPVVVDFWAPWCPPCMALKPELQRLAADAAGKARVAFVNVDEEPELAGKFGISSIPAVMIFSKGRRVDAWTGFAPRSAMLARLRRHMSG